MCSSLSMNFTALLLLLLLMGTKYSSPVLARGHHDECYNISYFTHPFKHVSDLHNSSIARWKMSVKAINNTHPQMYVPYAECIECTEPNLIIKPIILQVSIYKKAKGTWRACPYELEVGCTCVKKE